MSRSEVNPTLYHPHEKFVMPTDDGNDDAQRPVLRPLNPKLIRMLDSVADHQDLDLGRLLRDRFRVERPEQLTADQLTDLINELTPSGGSPPR